jgi:Ca2+-binding RTX toxin-like protein
LLETDYITNLETQVFQSISATNVFTGSAGVDTVDYSSSSAGVIADLTVGMGVNALGGIDRFVSIENLIGSAFDDTLCGNAANNTLKGGLGNDFIVGLDGRDVAVIDDARAAYAIWNGNTRAVVMGGQGVDTLEGIERVQFTDRTVALDVNAQQAAGDTVRIIGAAFDTPFLNPELVGIGIDLFDAGFSALQICELAIADGLFLNLAGSHSNVDFVDTVYQNVVGVLPTTAVRDSFVNMLQGNGGTMTQAELLMLAAYTPENAANINLVGLQQSGVDFV